MTEPLTFTIERDVDPDDRRWPHRLVWSSDPAAAWLTTAQADYLEALQARAAEPQGDYASLQADLVALRAEWDVTHGFEHLADLLTTILDAHPPLDLPEGFALTPTADAAAALAAVRTGKWTAHWGTGDEVWEAHLVWCVENTPDARFFMRPVSPPPMVRVGDGELPADASANEIVAAFRAQGGA